jgi:RNA polymerase sigma-70 factor (ECF subfamily)
VILLTDASQCELPLHDLLAACLDCRDAQLWEVLVRRLQPIFARVVYRVAGTTARADGVDDLIQECFIKLEATRGKPCARPSTFDCPEAALAYLKVLAANTARDYLRRRNAEMRSAAKTTSFEDRLTEIAGPDGQNLERDVLISQIGRFLGSDGKERTIFWLYYRQGFTAKEISGIPEFQLSPKGVESLLRRLTLAIRKQLHEGFSRPEAY